MADLTEEIIELQTKVLFQDDVIQKLDEVIIQQGKRLDGLLERINELEEKLEQLSFDRSNPAAVIDEKPPHY